LEKALEMAKTKTSLDENKTKIRDWSYYRQKMIQNDAWCFKNNVSLNKN
jgi:hypothetical protein